MLSSPLLGKFLTALFCLGLINSAQAESWPPLTPPQPLPLQWVLDKTLIRNPGIQSEARSYEAAQQRTRFLTLLDAQAERAGALDKINPLGPYRALGEADAELARIAVAEHHLKLAFDVRVAYFQYAAAHEAVTLAEQRQNFFKAFAPAMGVGVHTGVLLADANLDLAQAQADLALARQQKRQLALQLNLLLDRDIRQPLPDPATTTPSGLIADRDEWIRQALNAGIAMRRANAEINRAAAILDIVKREPLNGLINLGLFNLGRQQVSADAAKQLALGSATHELGRYQETLRTVEPETAAFILSQHDAARTRLDVIKLYETTIFPRLEKLEQNTLAAYGHGQATLMQVVETFKSRIAARQAVANLRVEYETAVAQLIRASGALPQHMAKFAVQPSGAIP